MKRILVIVLAILLAFPTFAQKIKVACVGDSITYGMTIADREHDSYPAQLQALLGDGYEVGNFGKSGATLLRRGHRPYMEQAEYRAALSFAGDIVVIHLGINDTDPRDWPVCGADFVKDYKALVEALREVNPGAQFYIARMTPLGAGHPRLLTGNIPYHRHIQHAIETVARETGAQLIDFYEPLIARPDLLPDSVHPNAEGAEILAKTVYSAITGDFSGLRVSPYYSDNMVLPRDKRFTICGTANAGEKVSVRIGCKKYTAKTGPDGRWSVEVGPMKATESTILRIETRGRQLRFDNVAIGELWLCSGQSNMEFELRQCSDPEGSPDPLLRLYDSKCRWRTDAVAWPADALDATDRLQHFQHAQWERATAENEAVFSAVGYWFGKTLRDSLGVPVGLICNAIGGSPVEAWIDRTTLEDGFPEILPDWWNNELIMPWVRQRAAQNLSGANRRHPYQPAYLFDAAIRPMEQFPISGVIWYQGESNAHNVEAFECLFPLLVDSWRGFFGDVPFYYAQLSYMERPLWPEFRAAQERLVHCRPGLGMVVTYDLGMAYEVHYPNKRPVGERLAGLEISRLRSR